MIHRKTLRSLKIHSSYNLATCEKKEWRADLAWRVSLKTNVDLWLLSVVDPANLVVEATKPRAEGVPRKLTVGQPQQCYVRQTMEKQLTQPHCEDFTGTRCALKWSSSRLHQARLHLTYTTTITLKVCLCQHMLTTITILTRELMSHTYLRFHSSGETGNVSVIGYKVFLPPDSWRMCTVYVVHISIVLVHCNGEF